MQNTTPAGDRLVIAVDCDDVLLPSTEYIVNAYNRMHGTSVRMDGAHASGSPEWGVDRELVHQRIDDIQRGEEYGLIRPPEATIDAVRRLAANHELHLVTARQPSVSVVTQRMVDRFFPDCFVAIEHVGKDGTKGNVCARIGAHVLIDDNARYLQDAHEHGVSHMGLLWFGDYPWQNNPAQVANRRLIRCRNWSDVERAVDRLALSEVESAGRQ